MTKTPLKPSQKHSASGFAGAPILEWCAAALGLVLSLAVIGFLTWEGIRGDDGRPSLVASAGKSEQTTAGHYVPVRLENQGRVTASAVEVEGELQRNGVAVESASVTFDFLPEGSERTGGLFFRHDPNAYDVRLTVKGQVDP